MFPAARKGDPLTHDTLVPSGVIGPPLAGPCPKGPVLIEALPSAHANCTAVCTGVISAGLAHPPPPGPPPPVISGSGTVLIHGMPAARWTPSGDMAGCGSMLGLPALAATRKVFIGGPAVFVGSRVYTSAPTLADLTSDPFVDQELQRAFDESNPNAPDVPRGSPGSLKQEQGGWLVWNRTTGQVEVQRVPAGTRDGLGTIVGTRPPDNASQQVVGWFHTHPNTSAEGYGHGPSAGDRGWQNAEAKVPGIIETHAGRQTIPYP